jgi:hypothetical protein
MTSSRLSKLRESDSNSAIPSGRSFPHWPPSLARLYAFSVAQICNLPYRRIASCIASRISEALDSADALPITNRRYGRVQLCATTQGTLYTYERLGYFQSSLREMTNCPTAQFSADDIKHTPLPGVGVKSNQPTAKPKPQTPVPEAAGQS